MEEPHRCSHFEASQAAIQRRPHDAAHAASATHQAATKTC